MNANAVVHINGQGTISAPGGERGSIRRLGPRKTILEICEGKLNQIYNHRMTGDGSFFPDPPASQYYNSSKSVLSYHPVLEFNGNKNDFWLLFDDGDMLEKRRSRPLRKPQKPSEPQASSSKEAVSKPGFLNTFSEATPKSGFLRPKDELEPETSVVSDRRTSKVRLDLDDKKARLDRLIRSAYDSVPKKNEATSTTKSSERWPSPNRERHRSRSPARRRSRSPGRRRSPVRDRRGLYRDSRRSRSREGRGRDGSRSRDRFRRSKERERRRESPSSIRKDSRSRRSSSISSNSSDIGKGKADKAGSVEILKKFAEKLQEQASNAAKKSLSSVRLNSRLEDTKHRRAEPVTPIVFSLKKAPVKAFPATTMPQKLEPVAEPMELSEPSEQLPSAIDIPVPTTMPYTVPPSSVPVPPLASQVPPPLIPGNLPISQHLQPLRVTDGVTVACAPTRYKDGKAAPVLSSVIALPQSSQPPPANVRVPLPVISQPSPTTSQPTPMVSVPPSKMEVPAITGAHQNLASKALEYAVMTQVQDSMLQMGLPPPGYGPMMRVPPGPPPGLPRPGHGIRLGMMGPGGPMMMGPGHFGGPGQFMGMPPQGPDGQFMGPFGPDGQFMGPPPQGPDQFMGMPLQGPDGQFMGPPPFGPDGQFMGLPPQGPDQFMGMPPQEPDGRQFMGPPSGPDGQLSMGLPGPGIGPSFFRSQDGPVSNNIPISISSTQSISSRYHTQQPTKNVSAPAKVEVKTTSSVRLIPSTVEKGKQLVAEKTKISSSASSVKKSITIAEKVRTTSTIPDKKKSPPKPVLSSLTIPSFEKVEFMVGLIKFLQDRSNLNVQIKMLKTSPSEEYCIKNDLLCKLQKRPDGDVLTIVIPEGGNARKTIVTAFVLKYPALDVDALIELFEQTFHNMPMEDIEDVFEDEATRKSTLLKSTAADFSKIKSVSSCGTVVLQDESSKNAKVENVTAAQKIVEVGKAKPAGSSNENVETVTPTQKIVAVEKVKSDESSDLKEQKSEIEESCDKNVMEEMAKAHSSGKLEKVATEPTKDTGKTSSSTQENRKASEVPCKGSRVSVTTKNIEPAEDKKDESPRSAPVVVAEQTKLHTQDESSKAKVERTDSTSGEKSELKTTVSDKPEATPPCPAKEPVMAEKNPLDQLADRETTNVAAINVDNQATAVESASEVDAVSKSSGSIDSDTQIRSLDAIKEPIVIAETRVTQVHPTGALNTEDVAGKMTGIQLKSESMETTEIVLKPSKEEETHAGYKGEATKSEDIGVPTQAVTSPASTGSEVAPNLILNEPRTPTPSGELKNTIEHTPKHSYPLTPKTTIECDLAINNIASLEEDKKFEPIEVPSTVPTVAAEQTKPPTHHESSEEKDVVSDSTSEKQSELNAVASEKDESVALPPIEQPMLAEGSPVKGAEGSPVEGPDEAPTDQLFDPAESETPTLIEIAAPQTDAVSKASDTIDAHTKNKSQEAAKEPSEDIINEPAPCGRIKTLDDVMDRVVEIQTQSELMETSEIHVKLPDDGKIPTFLGDGVSNFHHVGAATQKMEATALSEPESTAESVASKDIEQMKNSTSEKIFETEALAFEEAGAITPSIAEEPISTVINPPSDQPVPSKTLEVIGKTTSEVSAVSKASKCDSDTENTSLDAAKEPNKNITIQPASSVASETNKGVTNIALEILTSPGSTEPTGIIAVKHPVDERTPASEASEPLHVGLIAGSDEVTGSEVGDEPATSAESADAKDIETIKEDKNIELRELGDKACFCLGAAVFPVQKETPAQPDSSKVREDAENSTCEKKLELNATVSEETEAVTLSPGENPVLTEKHPPNNQPSDPVLSETATVIEKSGFEGDTASKAPDSIDTGTKNKSPESFKEFAGVTETCSTQSLPTEAAEPPKVIDVRDRKDASDLTKQVASMEAIITDGTSLVSVGKIPAQSDESKTARKLDPLQELPLAAVQQKNVSNEPPPCEGNATCEEVIGEAVELQAQPEAMETSDIPAVKEENKAKEDISESVITEDVSYQPADGKSTEGAVAFEDTDKTIPESESQPPSISATNNTIVHSESDDLIQAISSTKQIVAVTKSEEVKADIKEEPEPQPESMNVEEEPTATETDTAKSEIIPAKTALPQKPRFSRFKSTYELMKSMDFGEPKELYEEPDALSVVNYDKLSFFTSRLKEIQRGSDVASIITNMLLVPYNPTDEFVMKSGLLCKRKDQQKNDVFIVLLKSTAVYREIVSALTEEYPDLEFNEFMSLIDSSFTYITPDAIKSLTETVNQQAVNIKYQNFIERCNIVNYDIIQTMLEQLRNYQKADSVIHHRYTRLKANGGLDDSYILKYDLVCQFVGSISFKVWLPKSQPDQIAIMYVVHETNHNQDLVKFLELLRATFEGVNASLIDRPIALCSVCHPPATAAATSMVKACEQKCAALKSLPPEVIFKIRQIQMASSVFKAQIDLLTKGQSRQGSRYILDTSLLCKAMTKGDKQVYRVVVPPSGVKEVISLLHMTYHRKPFDEFLSFVSEFLVVTKVVCEAAFQDCYMCTKSKMQNTAVATLKPRTSNVIDTPKEKKTSEPPREKVKGGSSFSSKIPSGKYAEQQEQRNTTKERAKSVKHDSSKPSSQQEAANTSKAAEPEPSKPTWEVKEKSAPPPRTPQGEKLRREIMGDLRRYSRIYGYDLKGRIGEILRILPDRILTDVITYQRSCPELSKTIKDLSRRNPVTHAQELLCGGMLFVLKGKTKPKIAVKTIKNINFLLISKIHSEVHDWSINKVHGTIGIAFDISPRKEEVAATIGQFCHRCIKPETKKNKVYSSLDEELKDFYCAIEPAVNPAKAPKKKEEKPGKSVENKSAAVLDEIHQEINKDLQMLGEIWGKELGNKIKAVSQPIPTAVLKEVIAAQRECSSLMEIIEPLETEPPVKDARYVLCGGLLFVVKSKKKQMLVKIHVKPIKNISYILITNLHAKCHDWPVNRLQTTIGVSFDVSPTREEVAVTIDWFCLECQKPDTKSKKKKTAASLEDQLKDLYDTMDPSLLVSKDDDDDQEGTIDPTQEVPVTDVRAAFAHLPNPVVSKIQQAQMQSNVLNTQIKLLENTEGPAKGKGYCLVMSLLCKLVEVDGKPAWRLMIPSDMLEELVIELHTVHYHDMIQEDFYEYLNTFMTVPEDMINKLFASCALCLTTVRRVPTLCERGINEDHLRKTLANIAEMIEYVIKWQTECPQIAKIREGVKRCRQEIIEEYILYKNILFKLSGKGKGGKGPKGKIAVSLLPNALQEVIKGVHAFYHSSNPNQLMNLINTSFDVTARRDVMLKTIPEVCKICQKKSETAQQGDASTGSIDQSAADVKEETEKPDDASSIRESSGGTIIKEEVDLPIEISAKEEGKVDLPFEIKPEEEEPTPLGVLLLGKLCDQVIEESSNSSRALDSPVPDLTEPKPSLVVLQPYKIALKRCAYDPDIVQLSEGATSRKRNPKKPPAKRGRPPKGEKIVEALESEEESDSGSSLPKRKFVMYSSESETDDSASRKRKATSGSTQRAKKPKK